MNISINDISTLINKKINDPQLIPINNVQYYPKNAPAVILWEKNNEIPPEKVSAWQNKGIEYIDLKYSNSLLRSLLIHCSENYRRPVAIKNLVEIDKIIETLQQLNRVSKRERYIVPACELYEEKNNMFVPLFKFGGRLDFKKWNEIKRNLNKNIKLPIYFSERGIIILVDLTKQDSNFIGRFKKNADLCTLLTQRRKDSAKFNISPDFNPIADIWGVSDPAELLKTYSEENARLIVLGDQMNESYKAALLEVKKYDRFARFM
ncbi:MAG: hypothetical protein KAS39_07710, partial [Actinomycetia bacterium]|nr:hypothetical protein [Actinomycetes bacterium]